MKKILLLILVFFAFNIYAAELEKTLEKNLRINFEKRGLKNITVDVSIIKEVPEIKGYYLVKAVIVDGNNNNKSVQYLVSNGTFLLPDIVDIAKGNSVIKDMVFMYDVAQIDTTKLTLLSGNRNSKNIIVEVSDFECPYCRKANEYLMSKLATKKDVAVYLMHYPLSIHKKAMLYARVLEAGNKLGKNFAAELYSGKYDSMPDKQVIETFGNMSGKKVEFEKLVDSKEIADRISQHVAMADKYGINSTPVIFINGRRVEGYNTQLIDKGFSLMK